VYFDDPAAVMPACVERLDERPDGNWRPWLAVASGWNARLDRPQPPDGAALVGRRCSTRGTAWLLASGFPLSLHTPSWIPAPWPAGSATRRLRPVQACCSSIGPATPARRMRKLLAHRRTRLPPLRRNQSSGPQVVKRPQKARSLVAASTSTPPPRLMRSGGQAPERSICARRFACRRPA
jgi:hypothetical protein